MGHCLWLIQVYLCIRGGKDSDDTGSSLGFYSLILFRTPIIKSIVT